ncbi:MAG: hypothetical protein ACRD4B_01240, partial [Acidobacteriota bacterium]
MDNAPASYAPDLVFTEGAFGAVAWKLSRALYDVLPHDERLEIFEVTREGIILPFFEHLYRRLLMQCGLTSIPE